MRQGKKIIALALVAAMLGGTFLQGESVQATGIENTTAMTQENTTTSEDVTNSEQPASSEEVVEKPTIPEQPASSEEVTEQPVLPEQPTAPVEPAIPERQRDPNVVLSNMNPATAKVIVLDAGHCAKHPGAKGNRLKEDTANLDITKACQNTLDSYADVTVYMTREDGSCPKDLGLGDCLSARSNLAKILDADFLISMHLNAGWSNGANALVAYDSGYHVNISKETQAYGRLALAELKKLGIANRGFLFRKSESGNRYKNGKLADYYSIVLHGVLNEIPAVIMENGYISSSSDCRKFFNTKAKRKKVGNADATALIKYYDLKQKVIKGTFKQENADTYYVTEDGKKLGGWVKTDRKWYYFDEYDGKMQKGFLTIGEDTFYLSPSTGEMLSGWFMVDNARYLAKGNGALVKNQVYSDGIYKYLFDPSGKQFEKGFRTFNEATYYIDSKGRVAIGVTKIKGKSYLFDKETGQMLYGYQKYGKKYYYLDTESGVMVKNKIVKINKNKYYFSSSGARKTGFVTYKNNKYYFSGKSGKMLTGWRKINKNYYYFSKKTGKMQKNKWIGKWYVNRKGIRTKRK